MSRFFVLPLILSIVSCRGTGWEGLSSVPSKQVLASPASAVAVIVPMTVELGGTASSSLSSDDKVVLISGIRSYFKVAHVPLNADQPVQIRVAAECSCVGFDKTLFVPSIAVFGENVAAMPLAAPKTEMFPNDVKRNVRWVASWEFSPPTTGRYQILIAADNPITARRSQRSMYSPWD